MIKFALLITFLILNSSLASYGQDCGYGTYTIKFVPKGKFDFKLFSLFPQNIPPNQENTFEKFQDWFSKVFSQMDLKNTHTYCCYMTQVETKAAENFLKSYKKEDFKRLNELNDLPNQLEGSSKINSINFKTVETLPYPTLLKISSKRYGKFYFVGVFLGGCDRNQTFNLSKSK